MLSPLVWNMLSKRLHASHLPPLNAHVLPAHMHFRIFPTMRARVALQAKLRADGPTILFSCCSLVNTAEW